MGVVLAIVLSGAIAATAPPASSLPGSRGNGLALDNVSYAYEDVNLATNGTGWNGLSSYAFGGVRFVLWVENGSAGEGYVQGTGTELHGPTLVFALVPPTGPGAERPWLAPDGVFGVGWLGYAAGTVSLRLYVSYPLLVYESETVAPPMPGSYASNGTPLNVRFDGVDFRLVLYQTFQIEGLNVTATFADGSSYDLLLGVGGAVEVACGLSSNTPQYLVNGASCLEAASADHRVAMVWDGGQNVTLMVRSPVGASEALAGPAYAPR